MYDSIKETKQREIFLLEEKIKNSLEINPTNLNSYFSDFLFKDAKRLRPLFVFFICDLINVEVDEKIIDLACSIELLHSASLIHDDILDDAKLRRGKPSIHVEEGIKKAVLAGDYLLSLAMDFISKIGNAGVLNIISKASYKMVRSELFSLDTRYKIQDVETYLKVSKEKTSTLFTSAIQALFEIKNVTPDKNLLDFAEKFSLCFQIRDDINNYLNLDKNKISSDFEEGIYTLPFILQENAADEFLENLILETENCLSEYKNREKLVLLLNLFKRSNR